MRAAWYELQGPTDVLRVGDLPAPQPGPGEVRVRVAYSGVNPGDVKKRAGREGSLMPFPRVVPHSDGSGVVDAVGPGVDPARVGRRVWVWGAQSYRPAGTAAELTVVPADRAVDAPDAVADQVGAALGIPGITAHRAVFGDGPVTGRTVLVHGVLGAVGSMAAQLARWGGARVVGTVRSGVDVGEVDPSVADHVVALDDDPVTTIRHLSSGGVDRVVEVALAANADLDARVVANEAVIAAYATDDERTTIPFWPLLFANVTLRLIGSDDFPDEARHRAVQDLAAAVSQGALSVSIAQILPLERIAEAHDLVARGGGRGRVLLALGNP